ncbi:unnamed protein product, partial [Amoebophrya sp. A120]|eukprot:GSA120T00008398001.1
MTARGPPCYRRRSAARLLASCVAMLARRPPVSRPYIGGRLLVCCCRVGPPGCPAARARPPVATRMEGKWGRVGWGLFGNTQRKPRAPGAQWAGPGCSKGLPAEGARSAVRARAPRHGSCGAAPGVVFAGRLQRKWVVRWLRSRRWQQIVWMAAGGASPVRGHGPSADGLRSIPPDRSDRAPASSRFLHARNSYISAAG